MVKPLLAAVACGTAPEVIDVAAGVDPVTAEVGPDPEAWADAIPTETSTTVRAKARVSRSSKAQNQTTPRQKQTVNPSSGNVGDLLDRIARCESGGNPRAVSPSGKYRGAWQWDLPTWRSAGGAGDPINFDYATQKAVAYRLYQMRGIQPWPHCGPKALRG